MLKLNEIHYHPATSEKPVLQNLNLFAQKGAPIIISGPSGSGKTTLIEIISGFSKPHRGFVSWKEKKAGERKRRGLCGVVFQFPERHFVGITVDQELRLGHRRLTTDIQLQTLKQVGLRDIDLLMPPEKLSGGQQRRLAIAVQLLRRPDILLLDEPTAGLDWSVRGEVLNLINSLSKNQILIVVTHENELFRDWSISSSYQLRNGKLI